MDPRLAAGDRAADPFLPPMIKAGDLVAPKAPNDLADIPDEKEALFDMGVKLASTVALLFAAAALYPQSLYRATICASESQFFLNGLSSVRRRRTSGHSIGL